jgi:hypothetical protein
MKIITTLLTLLVCVSIAGAADKEGDKPKKEEGSRSEGEKPGPRDKAKQQEEMFKQMDANSDGKVSKEEFTAKGGDKAAAAAERFTKMDRNKDGELTKREFSTPVYESAGDRRRTEGDKPGKSSEGDKPGDKPGEKKTEDKK